jgi:hypothetical protein
VRKLPPLPPTPKRPLPAPERGPAIEVNAVEWQDDESSTGKVNATMAVYSSLLSVFDKASPARRGQIVELASECADLPDEAMETVLRVARGLR